MGKNLKKCLMKNGVYIVSGFLDKSQDNNIVKVGFQNIIMQVFDTEQEADDYIKSIGGL